MDTISQDRIIRRPRVGTYTSPDTEKEGFLPQPSKDIALSKEEIGRRVRALRQARDLTQAELAKAIGTHPPNVSMIERGLRGLSLQQAVKLSRALGVSPAEILGPGKPSFEKKRPPSAKLLRRVERIQALPKPKQRTILDLLDAYIEKHSAEDSRR